MTLRSALMAFLVSSTASMAQNSELPQRDTPIPQTTSGVPHVQLGIEADPLLSQLLLDRIAKLHGVELGPTRVSLPGAVGFRLEDDLPLARPEVIVGGREFAHLHPDGSLHASLDPKLAKAAIQAGWAIAHPWASQRDGWEGFVMIYTPMTEPELKVVIGLVEQSYTYVTGRAANN